MQFNRRNKIAAATGMSAIAVLAVVGGTLAQFTDSDTADQQVLTAGTVEVTAVEGANWTTNLGNLAIGDEKATSVVVSNDSTLVLKSLVLSADVTSAAGPLGGNLADRVSVTITDADANVLANDVALSALVAGYPLDLVANVAGDDETLNFNYVVNGDDLEVSGAREDVVGNPDNAYQGATLSVDYTIDAVQRDGVVQP